MEKEIEKLRQLKEEREKMKQRQSTAVEKVKEKQGGRDTTATV